MKFYLFCFLLPSTQALHQGTAQSKTQPTASTAASVTTPTWTIQCSRITSLSSGLRGQFLTRMRGCSNNENRPQKKLTLAAHKGVGYFCSSVMGSLKACGNAIARLLMTVMGSHGQCKGMRQRNSPFTYDSHGQFKGMRQRNSPFTYDNANDILECAYNLNGFRTKTKLKNTVLCLIELLIVEAVLK